MADADESTGKTKDYYDKRAYTGHHLTPVENLDDPLIIEAAPTGSFIRRSENPNQPYTPDEIAADVIAACEAGASMCHLHVRDEDGYPDQRPEVLVDTIERINEEYDPIITINVRGHRGGATYGKPLLDQTIGTIIEDYGEGYVDMVTFAPLSRASDPSAPFAMNEEIFEEMVNYLYDHGVRPELQAYNFKAFEHVKSWGIETGLLEKPYYMNAVSGHHGSYVAGPSYPFKPAAEYLNTALETNGLPPEDTILGANVGGRNWLPFTAQAVLLGFDSIRTGMEEAVTLYPHRDEKIQSTAQMVDKVATFAETLGRDVLTVDEARRAHGLD